MKWATLAGIVIMTAMLFAWLTCSAYARGRKQFASYHAWRKRSAKDVVQARALIITIWLGELPRYFPSLGSHSERESKRQCVTTYRWGGE